MLMDLRLAWRSLRRSPVFAATAVLTLGIGIGGSTAIFSIVNAVLLRPLPFQDPARLVRIWESNPAEGKDRVEVAAANFDDWRQRSSTFDDFALYNDFADPVVLGVGDTSIQVRQTIVTPNLFALLGVPPAVGREFGALREKTGPLDGREVILSDELWRRAFGGDSAVIGRTVRIEGLTDSVVVGVMPPGFSFPSRTDVWVPIDLGRAGTRRGDRRYAALGRLSANATLASARAELQLVAAALARDHAATNAGWTVAVVPLRDSIVDNHRRGLITLFAAVAFVMLLGCANLSNLLLARGSARRSELAVRTALGASRGRITRLLFTETAVLAFLGGAAGLALAGALLPMLVQLAGETVPRLVQARLSGAALAFCAIAAVSTALVAGVIPAIRLARPDLRAATSPEGERSTRLRPDMRLQRMVVAGELAVCLVLLVGATLFIQTFFRLKAIDLGFNPEHVISIEARIPLYRTLAPNRWQRLAIDMSTVLQRLRSVPGIQAVSATSDVPLSGNLLTTDVTVSGDARTRQAFYHRVSPDYFRTIGMTWVQGRDFTEDDASDLARLPDPRGGLPKRGAVIVNETTASAFWPAGNALGQVLSTSFDARVISGREVVGVVRDARSETLRRAPPAEVYVPFLEDPSFVMTLLVRTALPPEQAVPALRREIEAVTPDLSTANIRMLDDIVGDSIGSARFSTLVVSVFAAVALLLSALGVFGVFAFGAVARIREIGIRMAVGATEGDITRMFLKQAAGPIGLGVVTGAAGALALGRLVSSLLFGVTPSDPVSFASAALLLVAVAGVASYLPIRRVLRTDPASALRT